MKRKKVANRDTIELQRQKKTGNEERGVKNIPKRKKKGTKRTKSEK